MVTGQAEPDIVFREQHLPKRIEVSGFVVSNPKQFRKSKAGEHWICRPGQHCLSAHRVVKAINLRLAALIAPDQSRPDDSVCSIEHHQTVHLAGKPDTSYIRASDARFRQYTANGLFAGVPPVLRPLDRKST